MKYLLLLIAIFPTMMWAQPEVASKVEVDGKKYYQHIVEAGNTLWGLQRMYGVKVDEIVAVNPEIKDGLQTGQVVLVPVTEQSIRKIPTQDYKVKKKETLYGISQKFSISIDDLIVLNPTLKDGLKKGQVIQVPQGVSPFSSDASEVTRTVESDAPNPFVTKVQASDSGAIKPIKFVFEDSIVLHKVLAHETMYSVSKRFMVPVEEIMSENNLTSFTIREGQVLKIPIKVERVEELTIKPVPEDVLVEGAYNPFGVGEIEFEEKERYKVVVMLPFMTGMTGKKAEAISTIATQFYMGVKFALDSLDKKGLNADIKIIDTKNDSATINRILHSEDMLGTDLIIGPLFHSHFKQVAEFGRQHKTRVVLPAESSIKDLESNRLVYQSIPSNIDLNYNLGKYLAEKNAHHKIILVNTGKQDSILRASFKSGLNTVKKANKINLIEAYPASVTGHLTRGVKTHIIVPTENGKKAKEFFTLLNRGAHRIASKDLSVYGERAWANIEAIPDDMKNKFKWRFASPNFIDYYSDEMIEMNTEFRKKYNTDFSKMAVHGYDIATFFLSAFFLSEKQPKLLMSRFDLEQLNESSGYMNRATFVVENDDFELFNSEEKND